MLKIKPFDELIKEFLQSSRKNYNNAKSLISINYNEQKKKEAEFIIKKYNFYQKILKSLEYNNQITQCLSVAVSGRKINYILEQLEKHELISQNIRQKRFYANKVREITLKEKITVFVEDCKEKLKSIINNFLDGEAIDYDFFIEFCNILNLDIEKQIKTLSISKAKQNIIIQKTDAFIANKSNPSLLFNETNKIEFISKYIKKEYMTTIIKSIENFYQNQVISKENFRMISRLIISKLIERRKKLIRLLSIYDEVIDNNLTIDSNFFKISNKLTDILILSEINLILAQCRNKIKKKDDEYLKKQIDISEIINLFFNKIDEDKIFSFSLKEIKQKTLSEIKSENLKTLGIYIFNLIKLSYHENARIEFVSHFIENKIIESIQEYYQNKFISKEIFYLICKLIEVEKPMDLVDSLKISDENKEKLIEEKEIINKKKVDKYITKEKKIDFLFEKYGNNIPFPYPDGNLTDKLLKSINDFFDQKQIPLGVFRLICYSLDFYDIKNPLSTTDLGTVIKKLNNVNSVLTIISNREKQANNLENFTLKDKINLLAEYLSLKDKVELINNFFKGYPIAYDLFYELCFSLGISNKILDIIDINYLKNITLEVPIVRNNHSRRIENDCGTLHILNVARKMTLNELYVDVNILEEPNSFQHKELSELVNNLIDSSEDNWHRLFIGSSSSRIPSLDAIDKYQKLMILGKPGSGKSTFLQFIATNCILGKYESDKIPIFIRLKQLSEDFNKAHNFDFFSYIVEQIDLTFSLKKKTLIVKNILDYGQAIILLDGLDEIPDKNSYEIINEINSFCNNFYKNKFIMTCRVAAQEYNLNRFTYVEIADFNPEQIDLFAKNWFSCFIENAKEAEQKSKEFQKNLRCPNNKGIYELAVTPILLTLTCLVFRENNVFPSNRAYLYEEGIDILLNQWDNFKNIKREKENSIYKKLNTFEKKELLTIIAANMFLESKYIFEKHNIVNYIVKYLNDFDNSNEQKNEQADQILTNIKLHGLLIERAKNIYSFSHLTFQEYFTAHYFIVQKNLTIWKILIDNIGEKRWREVFLLTADLFDQVENPDQRLSIMIDQTFNIIKSDEKILEILAWINTIYYRVKDLSSFPFTLKAFIFEVIVFMQNQEGYSINFENRRFIPYSSNDSFRKFFNHQKNEIIENIRNLNDIPLEDIKYFAEILPTLVYHEFKKQQSINIKKISIENYWKLNNKAWLKLSSVIKPIRERSNTIFNFNNEQKKLIEKYYDCCNIIMICLNNAVKLNPEQRQKIENSIFLPNSMYQGDTTDKNQRMPSNQQQNNSIINNTTTINISDGDYNETNVSDNAQYAKRDFYENV